MISAGIHFTIAPKILSSSEGEAGTVRDRGASLRTTRGLNRGIRVLSYHREYHLKKKILLHKIQEVIPRLLLFWRRCCPRFVLWIIFECLPIRFSFEASSMASRN